MSSFITACPQCHSLNRIEGEKALKDAPRCGQCKQSLKLHGLVSEVNGDDMRRIIEKSDTPVIVDFWAEWCGPCKMYGPQFQQASVETDKAVFLKVNTESNQQISAQLGIRGIPTTVVFKNGQEATRQSGALSVPMIHQLINQNI